MKSRRSGLILTQFLLVLLLLAAGRSMASASSQAVRSTEPTSPEQLDPIGDRPGTIAPTAAEAYLRATGRTSGAEKRSAVVFPAPVSDDFNVCRLDTGLWTYVDPLGDTAMGLTGTQTTDAWFEIEIPGGVRHTLTGSSTDAPRLMQSIDNSDFEVEVKFESGVSQAFQIQGLLIEENPDTRFLRFDFEGSTSSTRIYASSVTAPTVTDLIDTSIAISETAPLYMRVIRQGNVFTQTYSFDGMAWITAGSFTDTITSTAIGVFAGNAGANPAHKAQFDYFFNTASPISPEDGAVVELLTGTVGSGTVMRTPDLPTYACNQVVTLTATADPGWSFQSWSGDASGATNPITTTMDSTQAITATFTQDAYTLDTNVVGSGGVSKNPDQPTYTFGEVVTLTATADPGWTFDSWSGDVTGNTNPIPTTIFGNQVVTATFTQNAYTLDTNVVGSGGVSKNPDQPTYTFGEVVTLTATADPGWTFDSWSGDVTGNTNPIPTTIFGNQVVTATFVGAPPVFEVHLPLVRKVDPVMPRGTAAQAKHLARTVDGIALFQKPSQSLAWLQPRSLLQ